MFQITSTPSGSTFLYTHPHDTNCYNCLKKDSIAPDSIIAFKLRQTKTSSQHVYYGVATESALTSPGNWAELLVLSASSGQIWQNGCWQPGGTPVKDGQTVTLYVDTRKWRVEWKVGESSGWSSEIGEKMRLKKLYLVVVMQDRGDTVELLF